MGVSAVEEVSVTQRQRWLPITHGKTGSSSLSDTCMTLMAAGPWTLMTSTVWPSKIPSWRERAPGMRPSSKKNKNVMQGLWDEIALIADFDKNGEVDTEEFMKGVEGACKGKAYQQFPEAFKFFIESCFRTLDADGDGSIGLDEFRYDCVSRMAYASVQDLDDAYERLLNDEDKKLGGITLERYQELYAQFLGNPDENCSASYLFGPLPSL